VSPSESFQEYLADVAKTFFDKWDKIFDDVEEYFTTWAWMKNILG
jgi:hypothetical protein